MNREQLAAATGMSAGAIAKIEGGKRDGHILSYKRLADALGIALKDVL